MVEINHFVLSTCMVFLFALAAGLYFIFKGKCDSERFFGIFWLSVSFWSFFVGIQSQLLKWMPGFWWGVLLHIGCVFVPVFFLHFTLHVNGFRGRLSNWLKLAYLTGAVFILLIIFTNVFTGEIVYRDHYAYPKPKILYPLYISFFQIIGIATLALLFNWSKRLPGPLKGTFHLFVLVHVLGYIGSMDNYLIMYDVRIFPLYPYGLYLLLPYIVCGSYAMRKLLQAQ